MENLSFQLPSWLILICILVALAYAVFLYWRSKRLNLEKKGLTAFLAILRGVPVFIICLLLLGPLLKQIVEQSKQPTVAILQDNSLSIESWAATNNIESIDNQIKNLGESLSEKYQVDKYTFGEDIRVQSSDSLDYSENLTNLSSALEYVNDIYEGENLGAIVLATDGIFNAGQNPLYASFSRNIPVYGIALGDTTIRKDVFVQNVLHNEVAYLEDKMQTQVDIKATNAENEVVQLRVEKEQGAGFTTVSTQNIRIDREDFFTTVPIELTFTEVGVAHYRYRLSVLGNEQNTANNRKDIYVEVLDARQEIGIIANAPHPDVTALKQLLEQNKNYEVRLFYEDPSVTELSELDLVIIHQLPSTERSLRTIVATLDNQKTPRIYVVGGQTNLSAFNQVQDLVTINGRSGSTNDAQGSLTDEFSNFLISDELRAQVGRFPPLSSPFGEYQLRGDVQTLFTQKIGDISTDFPLLSFSDNEGLKTAFLFGTDIWRWKLFDYLQNQDFNIISELIDKTIIYTSTKEDKRKFRVSTNNNVYLTNQDVIFSAELYNNSYELINEAEVVLNITGSDGSDFEYTFSRSNKAYMLNIGRLNPGPYTYRAETVFNGEQYVAEGRFVIREIQFELFDLEADHNLLYALSQSSNGRVSYPNEISDLQSYLINEVDLKPVIYQNVETKPLLDLKWLFLLLTLPLFLEWLIRRYYGSL